MTFLKNSKERAHPPPFPKVQLQVPISNLNGRGTGGSSWGLDLHRNNSLSLVGSQGWLRERWREQLEIHKRYQKLWIGEVSLFTAGVVADIEAVSKIRLNVFCRTSQALSSW